MKQQKQVLYKPKKEIPLIDKGDGRGFVPALTPISTAQITGRDVLDWIGNKLWDQRVFILATILILENVFLLVKLI